MNVITVFKEASKFSIPTALSAVLSLVLIPVISRAYPADQYGVINLFYSLGNFLMLLSLLGLDNAFIRFYQEPLDGLDKREAFSLSGTIGLLIVLALTAFTACFFADQASTYVFGEANMSALLLLGVYSISLIVFRLLSIVTRQELDAAGYNVQQIALILSNKVLYVLAVLFSSSYFPSILLMTGLTTVMGVIFLLSKYKDFLNVGFIKAPKASLSKFFQFALPTMPAAILMWLNSTVAKLMLAAFGRYDDVGIFALAFTIANAFSVLPAAFSVYWSPFVYKHYKDEQLLIKRMQGVLTVLAVILVVLFVGFQDVIYLLVGTAYAESKCYFMLVMLFPIQTLLVETVGYGIYLSNKTHLRLFITALSAATNTLLCFFLIPSIGGLGAAAALAVSALIMLGGSVLFGQKYYQSIGSVPKTTILYVVIITLCVGNYWASDNVGLRVTLEAAAVIISCVLYGREMVHSLKTFIARRQ